MHCKSALCEAGSGPPQWEDLCSPWVCDHDQISIVWIAAEFCPIHQMSGAFWIPSVFQNTSTGKIRKLHLHRTIHHRLFSFVIFETETKISFTVSMNFPFEVEKDTLSHLSSIIVKIGSKLVCAILLVEVSLLQMTNDAANGRVPAD